MEVHKFTCDCCGKDLKEDKITVSQNYQDSHWDGLMEEYETYTISKKWHLCPKCWGAIEQLVIRK